MPDLLCGICDEPPSKSGPRSQFFCPTCARNRLYSLRVEYAQVLLDKEAKGKKIEAAVGESPNPWPSRPPAAGKENEKAHGHEDRKKDDATPSAHPQPPDDDDIPTPSPNVWHVRNLKIELENSLDRINQIRAQNDFLRKDIANKQETVMPEKRAELAHKRELLETARRMTKEEGEQELVKARNGKQRAEWMEDKLHRQIVDARRGIVREVKRKVAGVRWRGKTKGEWGEEERDSYSIGGVEIPDLRALNAANPEKVSASLGNIAHIVLLLSYYLCIRLPAEIVPPEPGHPLPAILPPSHSYKTPQDDVDTDKPLPTRPPRSCPLNIHEKLGKMLKEDPVASSAFLDGACLLAWDVGWLARTQGLRRGTETWEDLCDVGGNLYRLLQLAEPAAAATTTAQKPGKEARKEERSTVAGSRLETRTRTSEAARMAGQPHSTRQARSVVASEVSTRTGDHKVAASKAAAPATATSRNVESLDAQGLSRAASRPSRISEPTSRDGAVPVDEERRGLGTALLGVWSHGTGYRLLCSAKGMAEGGLAGWRFTYSPDRLIEKVKVALVNEISSAEWEVLDGLDGREWASVLLESTAGMTATTTTATQQSRERDRDRDRHRHRHRHRSGGGGRHEQSSLGQTVVVSKDDVDVHLS